MTCVGETVNMSDLEEEFDSFSGISIAPPSSIDIPRTDVQAIHEGRTVVHIAPGTVVPNLEGTVVPPEGTVVPLEGTVIPNADAVVRSTTANDVRDHNNEWITAVSIDQEPNSVFSTTNVPTNDEANYAEQWVALQQGKHSLLKVTNSATFGLPVSEDIESFLQQLAVNIPAKSDLENLLNEYRTPSNVKWMRAPHLNKQAKAVSNPFSKNRDFSLCQVQNRVAALTTAVVRYIDLKIHSAKSPEEQAELKPLTDAVRIYASFQQKISAIRRDLLKSVVKPEHRINLFSHGENIDHEQLWSETALDDTMEQTKRSKIFSRPLPKIFRYNPYPRQQAKPATFTPSTAKQGASKNLKTPHKRGGARIFVTRKGKKRPFIENIPRHTSCNRILCYKNS